MATLRRGCDSCVNLSEVYMKSETATKPSVQHIPGLTLLGHNFDVPLDYEKPNGKSIKIFAREVRSTENANKDDMPFLIFLQGGPGNQSPRPESNGGWIKRVLKDYRLLLLDQRGTGLSTPVTHQTLSEFPDVSSQVEYLKYFRADNIVRDCEHIRKSLGKGKKWTVLGQSYGGFCITTYLSMHPEGLEGAILTGGFPPLVNSPDDVYRACYSRLIEKNEEFYARFPDDAEIVSRIVKHLQTNEVKLPCGETLTARRFLQLGICFGFKSAGQSMNTIHYLLESAFVPSMSKPTLSHIFLRGIENLFDFNSNPIYSILHEAIYCQGEASNWSAQRIMKEFPQFDLKNDRIFFTGEMIYPWMFDEYNCLKSSKEVAQKLAEFSDWPSIYDAKVLKKNTVPCVGTIYHGDLYVDRVFAEQTARTISGCKYWLTNEYEHDGIRQDGEKVLNHLIAMLKGEIA